MAEPTSLPQYQIDQIVSSIRVCLSDMGPRQLDNVCTAVRQELNSPTAMSRFEGLLDRYYKSNSDLSSKLESFHQTILTNQVQVATLLKQILEGKGTEEDYVDCPNTEDIKDIKKWLDEVLNGEEFKMKQQVRDLLESGVARKLRNIVITYATITALIAILTGVIGYFAVTSEIKKIGVTNDSLIQPK